MTYRELAGRLGCAVDRWADLEWRFITEDSRKAAPGGVFVATKGEHVDGHDFASQAAADGAVLVIGERKEFETLAGLPYLCVPNAREAAGLLAQYAAGDPTQNMTVIGVTGTNGKSSVVCLIQRILQHAGKPTAQFGTLGYFTGDTTLPANHTTPFAEDLADVFRRAKQFGCTHAAMEVSSHALAQKRVAGIAFDVGVLTNLTQDHLDYHGDMESYFQAKYLLFKSISGAGRFLVLNAADPHSARIAADAAVPCHTFGAGGDCRAKQIRFTPSGTAFRLESAWGSADLETRLVGLHNVDNVLAAIAVCGELGVPVAAMAEGMAKIDAVPGRFEPIDNGQDFQVIVDYAHTEDALRNALKAAREVCRGKIVAVFGCGGDRDKGKRPEMAAVAADLADYSVVTSDNPRGEDPARIILDIERGFQRAGKKKGDDYLAILDREEAIARGIGLAGPGDLVLIAGKGHEDYQVLGTKRIHFDDREVARALLETCRAP